MPTSVQAKKSLLDSLPPEIHGVIFELGSGWGTLAFPLARKYPHCQVIAYENSLIPFLFTRCCYLVYPLPNLTFSRMNFFKAPLSDANLVVCYLYPKAMELLKVKFEQELKRGTWMVSNTFAIPGWKPLRVIEINDLYKTKIYVYRK